MNIDSHRGIERPSDSKQEKALKLPFVIIVIVRERLRFHGVDRGVLQRKGITWSPSGLGTYLSKANPVSR